MKLALSATPCITGAVLSADIEVRDEDGSPQENNPPAKAKEQITAKLVFFILLSFFLCYFSKRHIVHIAVGPGNKTQGQGEERIDGDAQIGHNAC